MCMQRRRIQIFIVCMYTFFLSLFFCLRALTNKSKHILGILGNRRVEPSRAEPGRAGRNPAAA